MEHLGQGQQLRERKSEEIEIQGHKIGAIVTLSPLWSNILFFISLPPFCIS